MSKDEQIRDLTRRCEEMARALRCVVAEVENVEAGGYPVALGRCAGWAKMALEAAQ